MNESPVTQICPYCCEPVKDLQAFEPCQTCKLAMESGIMIVEIKNGQAGEKNPKRTGRIVVITEESFNQHFSMPAESKNERFFFLEKRLFNRVFGEALGKES